MPQWTHADLPNLADHVVLVTGANSGLGLETAKALAAKGAQVIMACRDLDKAIAAVDQVRAITPSARLVVRRLDLASLQSVAQLADEVLRSHPKLDVLVNNAGIMAPPRRLTADGFELQLGTNHLGHFALTAALLPALTRAPAPRIVNVSSLAHRWGRLAFDDLMGERSYSAWGAYGQSKLANLLFTFELQRRLHEAGLPAMAVAAHPGYADTALQQVGPAMTGATVSAAVMRLGNAVLAQSAAMGALPSLYAATATGVVGGQYVGPNGWFELRGHPTPVGCNARARNEADAKRLWEESVRLTGARWFA
jgi:NAD(P)-dependent dehydrogenase (short-subunit alcohol dehydrogenase family)